MSSSSSHLGPHGPTVQATNSARPYDVHVPRSPGRWYRRSPSSESPAPESQAPDSQGPDVRESDEALVDRVRAGDRVAFDGLYRRYFKRIYAFLDRRLDNRADTEETTQEVFINVFASLDSYRGEAPFAAWIFGVTRRTLAGRFKRKRHPTIPLSEEGEVGPGVGGWDETSPHASLEATPLEHYEMTERATRLRGALEEELSPEQRRIFALHHLESLPISEIARTLAKSEDAVKSNLYRTRKILLAR